MNPGSVSAWDRVPPPILDSASSMRTDFPAAARTMAAASPLGPAPTMIASTRPPPCPSPEGEGNIPGLSAKIDDGALRGGLNRDGVAAVGRNDGIDLVVGPRRIVVKQQQPLDAGGFGEADGVLDGRVPHWGKRSELATDQLGVMDQEVRRPGERDRGRVIGAEPGRPGPERDRAVVRKIGDRCAGAAHSVAIGEAALVRDLARDDVESLDRSGSFLDPEEAPLAAELSG